MIIFWIDPRYHNPKIIETVRIQVRVEDRRELRNEKGRNYPFYGESDKGFP